MRDDDDTTLNMHSQGTGGLTLEPPQEQESNVAIGFAVDVLQDVEPHPEFAHLDGPAADESGDVGANSAPLNIALNVDKNVTDKDAAPTREGASGENQWPLEHGASTSSPSGLGPKNAATFDYPLARAALSRLLTTLKATVSPEQNTPPSSSSMPSSQEASRSSSQDASGVLPAPASEKKKASSPSSNAVPDAFVIGPDVMRPPAKVQTPSPPSPPKEGRPETSAQMENMVDLFFTGAEEENQEQQIHLQFKEDVLGGLYLTLKKTDAGLVAHFVVSDKNTRRLVESQAHSLVARLEKKGIHVVDTLVELQGGAGAEPNQTSAAGEYFTAPDRFEEL